MYGMIAKYENPADAQSWDNSGPVLVFGVKKTRRKDNDF